VRSFIILSATAVFRRRFTFRASLQVFDTSIPFGHRPSTLIRMELKGCRKFTTIIIRSCSHDSTLPQLAPSLTILLPSLANAASLNIWSRMRWHSDNQYAASCSEKSYWLSLTYGLLGLLQSAPSIQPLISICLCSNHRAIAHTLFIFKVFVQGLCFMHEVPEIEGCNGFKTLRNPRQAHYPHFDWSSVEHQMSAHSPSLHYTHLGETSFKFFHLVYLLDHTLDEAIFFVSWLALFDVLFCSSHITEPSAHYAWGQAPGTWNWNV